MLGRILARHASISRTFHGSDVVVKLLSKASQGMLDIGASWSDTTFVLASARLVELEKCAQSPPLDTILAEVEAQEIVRSRAKDLFQRCCHANAGQFCNQYKLCVETQHVLRDMASSDLLSSQPKLGEELVKFDGKMSELRKISATLTAMVSLWRTMQSGEDRASLTSAALGLIGPDVVSKKLDKLVQASQGRQTYESGK